MIESQDARRNQESEQQTHMFKDLYDYDKRNCTDLCCLFIGFLFTIALLTIGIVGVNITHQNQVSLPSDTSGKVCGIDYPKYTFVYFTNPPDVTSRVCVSECPQPGSAQLDCRPSGDLGCKFNNIQKFSVVYYDNEEVIDTNGNFCMPTDPVIREQVTQNAHLDSRLVIFNSYSVLVLCILFSIGLSILFTFVVHCIPKTMVWVTIYTSLVVLIALAAVLFMYKTTHPGKIILGIILAAVFLIITLHACFYKQEVQIGAIFLQEGTRFTSNKPSTVFYIFLFMACTLGFFFMLIEEYRGFISVGAPSFDSQYIYYKVNNKGLWLTWVLLGIQLLWGLSFLKESFNFCISSHAVRHYLKKGGGACSITDTLSLLIFKHLGSVIGASFVNFFLFVPDIIADLFRFTDKAKTDSCDLGCVGFLDLVRSDAMAYVVLTGNSYCNSAKYCEYFTRESMTCDSTQSPLRLYRISAHILIAGIVSLVGLYIKGQIEPYTIAATIIIGMFVSTYIISYQADPAEAILLMFNIDQEYFRRQKVKLALSLNDETQQKTLLDWLSKEVSKREENSTLAQEIKELKAGHWAPISDLKTHSSNA